MFSTSPASVHRHEIILGGLFSKEETPASYVGAGFLAMIELEALGDLLVSRIGISFGYHVSGLGSPEVHELFIRTLYRGPLLTGQRISKEYFLPIPPQAPLSYEGAYIKIDWSFSLHFEQGEGLLWSKKIPLHVAPRPIDEEFSVSRSARNNPLGELDPVLLLLLQQKSQKYIHVPPVLPEIKANITGAFRKSNHRIEDSKNNTVAVPQTPAPLQNIADLQKSTASLPSAPLHGIADPQKSTSSLSPAPLHGIADPQTGLPEVLPASLHGIADPEIETDSVVLPAVSLQGIADPKVGQAALTSSTASLQGIADPKAGEELATFSAASLHGIADPQTGRVEVPSATLLNIADPQTGRSGVAPVFVEEVSDPQQGYRAVPAPNSEAIALISPEDAAEESTMQEPT